MILEHKPGTVVLHQEFGAGVIISNDGDRLEIDFKLRGRKTLDARIASPMMTVTGTAVHAKYGWGEIQRS